MPYAQKDIISHTTQKVYAPQNAEVTVIATLDSVLICEYKGNRFPCLKSLVGADKVVIEPEIIVNKKDPYKLF